MKVLVANRGAIARRVVRACQEMGLQSVAVFADADAQAPYLDEASEAFALSGNTAAETYLDQDELMDIARESGADAVHPGYGFLAENAEFAQRVLDAGLCFIGPQPKWLREMGDKVAARELFAKRGFPTFAGSERVQDEDAALGAAETIGYPVLVKPAGGGGGIGMQVAESPDALSGAFKRAGTVAASAFGKADVYLEKWIRRPRHIEYQILGDGQGRAMHLYERDCSVQRRNQKLIEESPAPGIDAAELLQHAEFAADLCATLEYDNVGTLETLRTQDGQSGFLEMNTRIQVEHGVTEAVTGLDLVQLQIRLAQGEMLPAMPERDGFAMEVRLYAEDPITLLPSTGRLVTFRPPKLTGVRVETGYREGQAVTPYYDALLAKLIAWGATREMAIGRLLVALRAFTVRGVTTNAPLLTRVLGHEEFLAGRFDTEFLAAQFSVY